LQTDLPAGPRTLRGAPAIGLFCFLKVASGVSGRKPPLACTDGVNRIIRRIRRTAPPGYAAAAA
jgi:hypothetical protein